MSQFRVTDPRNEQVLHNGLLVVRFGQPKIVRTEIVVMADIFNQ